MIEAKMRKKKVNFIGGLRLIAVVYLLIPMAAVSIAQIPVSRMAAGITADAIFEDSLVIDDFVIYSFYFPVDKFETEGRQYFIFRKGELLFSSQRCRFMDIYPGSFSLPPLSRQFLS